MQHGSVGVQMTGQTGSNPPGNLQTHTSSSMRLLLLSNPLCFLSGEVRLAERMRPTSASCQACEMHPAKRQIADVSLNIHEVMRG
jgi:hypothetical protein